MIDHYRIFGSELSPYSVKVRSYCRYKDIPYNWIIRNAAVKDEYSRYARIPLIPLVVTPQDKGIQDSTPIIEYLETEYPKPSIHPRDPVSGFVSAMIEEFGDEWGNKWMFHYRWAREIDRLCSAGRIARTMAPEADDEEHAALVTRVKERMINRVWFVGSNEQTAPQIEESFCEAIDLLETHLSSRAYLFGGRPSFGDFGLWGQIYCAWTDPTPGALVEGRAPCVLAWIHRMLWPRSVSDFEPWSSLQSTLLPFLEKQVGARFFPWTLANEKAIAEGREEFRVELNGQTWIQKPQKYHAKSLRALRDKYSAVVDKSELNPILEQSNCLSGLQDF